MKFWVDAQLPPKLAAWLAAEFQVEASSLRDLGLRDAADLEIFQQAAMQPGIVLISKDGDFVDMVVQIWPASPVALGEAPPVPECWPTQRHRRLNRGLNCPGSVINELFSADP